MQRLSSSPDAFGQSPKRIPPSCGGARFIVHHTDGTREFAYDRQSSIGKLDKALDESTRRKWAIVDMKQDWRTVYPAEKR